MGEIYVRLDPFANDFIVEKLEQRGIKVRFAPFNEWLEYTDYMNLLEGRRGGFSDRLSNLVQSRVQSATTAAMAKALGWPARTTVKDSSAAASDYLCKDLVGEAVLTLGGPIHEWREGHVDGVVSVGPHECMPNKISESQFFHVAQREGLLSLTLPLNGDPSDPELLDNFAFEVHAGFQKRGEDTPAESATRFERASRLFASLLRPLQKTQPETGKSPLMPASRLSRRPPATGATTEEQALRAFG